LISIETVAGAVHMHTHAAGGISSISEYGVKYSTGLSFNYSASRVGPWSQRAYRSITDHTSGHWPEIVSKTD